MKRKAYEDAGLPQPTEPSPKKQAVRAEKTPQVTVKTVTSSASVESQSKKQPQNGKGSLIVLIKGNSKSCFKLTLLSIYLFKVFYNYVSTYLEQVL
jgi:hypothetical protein